MRVDRLDFLLGALFAAALVPACGAPAQASGKPVPAPAAASAPEGKIGLLYAGGGDAVPAPADAPQIACAALPSAAPDAVERSAPYGAHLRAAMASAASIDAEAVLTPDLREQHQRIAWVKTCLRQWVEWRRGGLARADAAWRAAFAQGATPEERGATLVGSAEAWTRFGEAMLHALTAAEPEAWREAPPLHAAYADSSRAAAKLMVAKNVRASLDRCAEKGSATDAQRKACDAVAVRLSRLSGE